MNESLEKKFERMKLTNKLKKKNIDIEKRVDDKGKKQINYLINMCIYY